MLEEWGKNGPKGEAKQDAAASDNPWVKRLLPSEPDLRPDLALLAWEDEGGALADGPHQR
jgi:hypothetical protein